MRFKLEEGLVEGYPGPQERRIIDAYRLPPVSVPVKPKLSSSVLLVRNVDPALPAYRVAVRNDEAVNELLGTDMRNSEVADGSLGDGADGVFAGRANAGLRGALLGQADIGFESLMGQTDPDGASAPTEFPPDFPAVQNVEVFMLRRAKTMAFAPNAVVFPGGSVDKRDANTALPWFGPAPSEWAELMGCSENDARLAIVAAAREVFEESGVLLAGPDGSSTARTTDEAEKWASYRSRLAKHELSFAEVLIENDLMLRADLLGLVANLQTPHDEPRRYDTYFFSALMPEGQEADGNTSEATIAGWVTPARAVAEADAGRWRVMPPTMINLTYLTQARDAESFVQTRRKVDKCTLHVEYLDKLGERPILRWRSGDVLKGCRSDYDAEGNYQFPQGFIEDVEPWTGGWVQSRIYCHLNNNPSPMTYIGTNTWIVLAPSPEFRAERSFGESSCYERSCVVVDPGVLEEVPVILDWCRVRNLRIEAVLTTHCHADHTGGAAALAEATGCEWLSWGRGNLPEGEVLPGIRAIHTPGHTPDSVTLVIDGTMHAITGDLLFSQGPTILKEPDANLADYLASLDRVQKLVRKAHAKVFLTGHGCPIAQCHRIIDATRTHREERIGQIRTAIERGVAPTPEAIVDNVYAGIDPGLRGAALKSAAFQLHYLGYEQA